MSRRPAKPRSSSSKAFGSSTSGAFGGFSTGTSGSNLSYLSEPPDFSSISDAHVVVSFKNLLKKDSTTKAKALEELVAYVDAHPFEKDGGAEDPILDAWVQLYPRISIDNARRVRELSHTLQLDLMKSARKRMEKHIPKIVGTWLAGTFDKDRVVSRVATDGLSSFLTTEEKVTQFWKRCQPQILEYASDAIQETADTLSDERSTSPDDAEAKYHRVISGSLALVLNLLEKLDAADLEKYRDSYDQFFELEKIWESIGVNEPSVRKLVCQLLVTCLTKRSDATLSDLPRLSKVFVGDGLKSSQTGSATAYLDALNSLTSEAPTVWTTEYRGKKSLTSRLQSFAEKGSQSSGVKYWSSLSQLLAIIPSDILPRELDAANTFMRALRSGLSGREEPRSNLLEAWVCYLNAGKRILDNLKTEENQSKFAKENFYPLTEQYLFPTPEKSSWSIGNQIRPLLRAYYLTAAPTGTALSEDTKQEWVKHEEELCNHMRNSLPELSKEHEKSQKTVAEESTRWFTLVGTLLDSHAKTINSDKPIPDLPRQPSLEILSEALKLLSARNWKPFGAAVAIDAAMKYSPDLVNGSSAELTKFFEDLQRAIVENFDSFISASSAPFICDAINSLGRIPERKAEFESIWNSVLTAIVEDPDKARTDSSLVKLLSSSAASSPSRKLPALQSDILQRCLQWASGTTEHGKALLDAVLTFDVLTDASYKNLVKTFIEGVTQSRADPNVRLISAIQVIAQQKPNLLAEDDGAHMALMTSLLSLSERPNADPNIISLKSQLENPSVAGSNVLGIIQQNIHMIGPNPLGIDTLVAQATQAYETAKASGEGGELAELLTVLLPDVDVWEGELSNLFQGPLNPSLAVTSSLGGAYFLVENDSSGGKSSVERDQHGCSIAGRMGLYLVKLLSAGLDLSALPKSHQAGLITCLILTADLAADQVTTKDKNVIWSSVSVGRSMSSAESLVSSSLKIIDTITEDASGWRDGAGSENSQISFEVFRLLLNGAKSLTAQGIYYAKALGALVQSLTEKQGMPSSSESWLTKLDVLKSSPQTILPAVALLAGFGETVGGLRTVNNLCNRLVSDVAGAKLDSPKSLSDLVLLNACMPIYDIGELPVANNRLVFAVRQLTSWLEDPEDLDYRFAAEVCRSLQRLLPCIKDVYGSYWERAVEFCIHLWTKKSNDPLEYRLPYLHASLRLISAIQSLEDPNDDLLDVLQTTAERRSSALIELLQLPRDKETQPLDIIDGIICRQVEKLPLEHIKDLSDLYGLVASDSRAIQTAAFTVLHKALPAAQEQLALDVLLDKQDARLPDELLSLLLDAPTLEKYSDEMLSRFPTPVRSYLLSWHLVFDAFSAASFKVRGDYAENLKAENYIGPLMNFTFDVLGHSAAHALNLDKAKITIEQIRTFDLKLAESETEERNMQWLLIHLYYLVLKYLPGLFKAWYIDCRSKQTKIAVEAWMTKYFSPIIISDALDDVVEWAANQEPPADDEKELIVKVSRPAKEVTAGYEVDELQAAIAIKVPAEYPLENVSVVSISRVAVDERKWKSWIMTTEGVIKFSGGSIIDGLTAFRRNLVGALKGQTECAICYSIISSDKKMPDKRCQTCKNLFHRICLYKWFQSSNQNTCPLCRNPIDYLGADTSRRRAA